MMIILLFVSVNGFAGDSNWQLKKNAKDIQVYQKKQDGFKLKHHKAVTLIPGTAGVILAVLQDAEACPEWVFKCKSSQMLGATNMRTRIHYTNINAPLLFKDRDMYLRSNSAYYSQTKTVVIELDAVPDYDGEHKNRVRIRQVNMIWTLKAVDNKLTEVTYEVYLDPLIPVNALVNKFIFNSVFHTMHGLTKMVKQQKYHQQAYTQSELEFIRVD